MTNCAQDNGWSEYAGQVSGFDAARQQILDWLFVAAPIVAAGGALDIPSLSYQQTSQVFEVGDSCPDGGARAIRLRLREHAI